MKEADLKLQIVEYLQIGTNQGKWYADRLNSGEVIIVQGEGRRRIKLCREGTADFFVIQQDIIPAYPTHIGVKAPRIVFLEAKSDKGKQHPEQGAFQKLVGMQGAEYYIVQSLDEVIEILGEAT